MPDAPPLSVAFIERSPDTAARILEGIDPAGAAAVVGMLPTRIAGLAVGRMSPLCASRCLVAMETDQAAGVLRALPFQDAASALRVIEAAPRERLLEALPNRLSRSFERSLRYPRDSVGAWMDQQVSPVPDTRTVAEALEHLRKSKGPPSDSLFIVDAGNRFLGLVGLSRLMRLDERSIIGAAVDRTLAPLSSRAALSSVVGNPSWDSETSLAVVGRKGNFLGTLSRRQLRAGLAALSRRPARLDPNSILTHLLTGCFVTFAGLLSLMLRSADIAPPAPQPGDRHDD